MFRATRRRRSCRVGRFIGTADRARWRSAIRIGPVAHDGHVSFRDRFLQSLVLPFGDVNGQFVRLQIESRIGHFHVAAEDADVLVRIKERVIRINLRRDRLVRLRPSGAEPNGFVPMICLPSLLRLSFAFSFAGFSAFFAGAGESDGAAAISPKRCAPIAQTAKKQQHR